MKSVAQISISENFDGAIKGCRGRVLTACYAIIRPRTHGLELAYGHVGKRDRRTCYTGRGRSGRATEMLDHPSEFGQRQVPELLHRGDSLRVEEGARRDIESEALQRGGEDNRLRHVSDFAVSRCCFAASSEVFTVSRCCRDGRVVVFYEGFKSIFMTLVFTVYYQ